MRGLDNPGDDVKDPYATLGVRRTASTDEIKKAYRKLTRQLHPDRNPGDRAAEERFKDVSVAYEVLADPEKRAQFDEFGAASLTQGFDPARARAYKEAQSRYAGAGVGQEFGPEFEYFHDFGEARETSFDDLLSRLFGGGRVRTEVGRPRTRRGADIEGDVAVSFVDALHGVTVPLRIEGADGAGRTIDVKVPQGVGDGAKLRLRGQGGKGSPAGDIILTVGVRAHPRIDRDGNDLRMSVPVTALEAYRGGPIDVRTPWGHVTVRLPAASQNGRTLRVRGHGVRHPSKPAGDLLMTLDVRLPTAENDAELIAALDRLQGGANPRGGLGDL